MEKPIGRDEAIQQAMDAGRGPYPEVDRYQVRVTEDATHWKVEFTNPEARGRGAAEHFSVWVDKKSGAARLFRGR